jgi:2-oxoglutarate ferredoxin oxidoreductase subunit alpha
VAIDQALDQRTQVNDFSIKLANVNGTGSASANSLLMQAIFRMGIPVSGKNLFPSNIQGLPTWYEIRVNKTGYTARALNYDLVVAMNSQTYAQDIDDVRHGGYVIYDSSWPLDPDLTRGDVTFLGIPLAKMCLENFKAPRERILMKNIAYAGAVVALVGIDVDLVADLLAETFARNEALRDSNQRALRLGYDFAIENFSCPLPFHVERMDANGSAILVNGNLATALGCLYAGATVAGWYPITPATAVMDNFIQLCAKYRRETVVSEDPNVPDVTHNNYLIIQAEDEIASIGIVVGAGWNGARAFTCTSGPGISLMQEFVGLSYFAEIPAVIFDVQRGGPSTGMPTRTQQSDILAAAYASHGDTKHPLLFPEDPAECFEMGALAFDLAERLQTCIFVMLDLDIGMNEWLCRPFAWDDERRLDRGKLMTFEQLEAGEPFGRYRDVDGDGIPRRTLPGVHPSRGAYFTRGTSRDPDARYSEDGPVYVANMERLLAKFDSAKALIPAPIERPARRRTPHGVIYFGSSSAAMSESLQSLEAAGRHVDALRVRGFPFSDAVLDFIAAHETIFVVEQNRDAQLRTLIMTEGGVDPAKLVPILNYDGSPITARFITDEISRRLAGERTMGLRKAAQ